MDTNTNKEVLTPGKKMRLTYELVNRFDFYKVYRVMVALDWKWSLDEMRTPTVDEIRAQAVQLVFSVLCSGRPDAYRATGGLEVARRPWGDLELAFRVTGASLGSREMETGKLDYEAGKSPLDK